MSKKVVFGIIIVILIGIGFFVYINWDNLFPVAEETIDDTQISISSVEELEDSCYYVFHTDGKDFNKIDFNAIHSQNSFSLCPSFDQNWNDNNSYNQHVIWTDIYNDVDIPTLYEGDLLLYISSTEVPFEGIKWERFGEYGYSIGVVNFIKDKSGHFHINMSEKSDRLNHIYEKSDAADLFQFDDTDQLFLNKIGTTMVREDLVSDNGTIENLNKGSTYVCEWYTGTYYQDFKMVANVHPYSFLEKFTTYDYEFLHSNCVSITIPEWLKTGYYHVNGVGFFRYVKGDDVNKYNGDPYDPSIVWNDRIILLDEDGNVLVDPSTGFRADNADENIYSENYDNKGNEDSNYIDPVSGGNDGESGDYYGDDGQYGEDGEYLPYG